MFTAEQVERLLRPIKQHRVMQAQGQSHIPAYDVVAHLNRMFGFGGWDKEIVSIEMVEQRNDVPGKNGWYVTYRCHMRLIIRDPDGNVVTIKEDGACGSANNLPALGDAHDFAYKNAISYALKRCAKDLGDQFGLSLYNKGSVGALVGTTLVGRGEGNDSTDLEDHAPTPLSLGNDERQVDHETGEILSDEPAAPAEVDEVAAPNGREATGPQDVRRVVAGEAAASSSSPPLITGAQMRLMQKLLTEHGTTVDVAKREYAGKVVGREITSVTQLTIAEANKVIDSFQSTAVGS